jgi:hypothetical protein
VPVLQPSPLQRGRPVAVLIRDARQRPLIGGFQQFLALCVTPPPGQNIAQYQIGVIEVLVLFDEFPQRLFDGRRRPLLLIAFGKVVEAGLYGMVAPDKLSLFDGVFRVRRASARRRKERKEENWPRGMFACETRLE